MTWKVNVEDFRTHHYLIEKLIKSEEKNLLLWVRFEPLSRQRRLSNLHITIPYHTMGVLPST